LNKLVTISGTVLLDVAFVAAYGYLIAQVGRQSTGGTEAGMLAAALLLVLYLVWLFVVEGSLSAPASRSINEWSNFKKTIIALLLCLPAAFLFIGMLAPPFIVAASAVGLLVSLAKRSVAKREP
jgi:hypothetical protein